MQTDPETTSRAIGKELSVSPKHCREVLKELRGMKVETAKKYLRGVIDLDRARAVHEVQDVPEPEAEGRAQRGTR